jgi:hypothetical protein
VKQSLRKIGMVTGIAGAFLLLLLLSEGVYLVSKKPPEYYLYRYAFFLTTSRQFSAMGVDDWAWKQFSAAVDVKHEMKSLERNEALQQQGLLTVDGSTPTWIHLALRQEWQVYNLSQLQDKTKAELARMLVSIALWGEQENDWEQVERLARAAVAIAPEWSDFYRYLAKMQVKQQQIPAALATLADCAAFMGESCYQGEKEVLEQLQTVTGVQNQVSIEWNRVDIDNPMTLAYVSYMTGVDMVNAKPDSAERWLTQAVTIAPEWSVYWIELANFYAGRGNQVKAADILAACEEFYHPAEHCREYRLTQQFEAVGTYADEINAITLQN